MKQSYTICYTYCSAGKSLICKERAIQTAEREARDEIMELKSNASQVFFISMVGVNSCGKVENDQHIFDIYTKECDFWGSNVVVKSAQDLLNFYESQHPFVDGTQTIDIYTLVENFVEQHPYAHYVLDECPFLGMPHIGKWNNVYIKCYII